MINSKIAYLLQCLLLATIMVLCATDADAQAMAWQDVTDDFVKNPRFDNNNYDYWEGTPFTGYNPKENAEHYGRTFDTYQDLSGLEPMVRYRVTVYAFYRYGSAEQDYRTYSSGGYSRYQNAKLYVENANKTYNGTIKLLASGAQDKSLGGQTAMVSSKYVPNNMEAADYWFKSGFYKNSLIFYADSLGKARIGIRKTVEVSEDWLCLDDWMLEWYGPAIIAESLTISESAVKIARNETHALFATILPEKTSNKNVIWKSSNTKIAKVDSKGVITGVADGQCTITATSSSNSELIATCEVEVKTVAPNKNNIVINEVMSANGGVYRDPSTNFGPWIELYNPTDEGVDLGGMYVSNDPADLKKFRLAANYSTMPAHGFSVLHFDHFEPWTALSVRQIDFKLEYGGGTIILSDGENVFAQMDYPQISTRTSFARISDGGAEWGMSGNPTPGASNANGAFATEQLPAPVVNKDACLFTGTLRVRVTIPSGAELRYTTDGTLPTLENGEVSTTGVFSMNSTTCFRFRLFKDGYLPSTVVTRSYIYDTGNYVFPVVSVVTDKDNISGAKNGIYSYSTYGRPGNGQSTNYNANMDWDRPVNFEYITQDNECVVSQEVNMSTCGGWSRAWTPHSFKLKASKQYDLKSVINYQFFDEKPYLNIKTLQIRNGGNDNGCRIKDAAVQGIVAASGLDVEHQCWQPAHVFFNGEHYAVLNIREPNNKHYAYANYGIDSDEMDQFEIGPDSGYVQMEGTREKFQEWYDLSADAANADTYAKIRDIVDVDEFINYMAVQLYCGGNDWPQNNLKAFRDRNNGKFRFVLFDLDAALSTDSPFASFKSRKTYSFNSLYGYNYLTKKSIAGTHLTKEIEMVTIFLNMMKNEEFRLQFNTAFSIMGGSVFTEEKVGDVVYEMADYLSTGGWVYPWNTVYSVVSGFYNREKTMMNQLRGFTEARLTGKAMQSVDLYSNIADATLTINGRKVPYGQFNGHLFPPARVCAVAPAGYEFMYWIDEKATTSLDPKVKSVVSYDKEYDIAADRASSLCAMFRRINVAEYEKQGQSLVVVNEVGASNSMYENDMFKKSNWVELYNMSDKDVDIAGMYLSDDAGNIALYQIPENDEIATIVPAHGHLTVWATNEPAASGSGAIHADIVLNGKTGGKVSLYNADDKLIDVMPYAPHGGRQSAGRYPDGTRDVYLMDRTSLGDANFINSYSEYYCNSDDLSAPDDYLPQDITINLKKGWNWTSHPMATPVSIAAVNRFANGIYGQSASAVYDQTLGWVGKLTQMEPAQGYKIEMNQTADFTVNGNLYSTGNTVMLHQGWNWIGYPVVGTQSLADALSIAHCEEGDVIIGQQGIATYERGKWTGSLAVLTTGSAYMYKSKSLKSITFNGAKATGEARLRNAIESQPHTPWSAQTSAHPNVMGVVATVISDGVEAASGAYSVGAFDENGECRGIGRYADGRLWLTICGEGGEALYLQASEANTGVIYDINESLTFSPDMQGTFAAPVALTIGDATDIASVRRSTALESAEYYSMDGIRVATEKSSLRPGIYIARYHISGGQTISKKIRILNSEF